MTNGQNTDFAWWLCVCVRYALCMKLAHAHTETRSFREHWRGHSVMALVDSASFACRIKLKRQLAQRTNRLTINWFSFVLLLFCASDFSLVLFLFAGTWLHHCAAKHANARTYWWRYCSGSVTSIRCWIRWFTPTSIGTFERRSKTRWNACFSIAGTRRHRTALTTYNKYV